MKSSIKKFLGIGLITAMVAVNLAGCGGTKENTSAVQTGGQSAASTAEQTSEKPKEVTLKYLVNWNGSSAAAPADLANNPVAKAIKEKTGVTLDIEYCHQPETEKLNLVFASGDMPDFICGAFWGGSDANTQIYKKAAKEGLLLPLNEYVDKYAPTLKAAFTTGVAKDFRENDLEDSAFGGKHYILPVSTPATEQDYTDFAYNAYARKDILASLNIAPESITSSEAVYDLLKKIKAGGFKDSVGKPVIPAGAWHDGWQYKVLFNSYNDNSLSEQFTQIDGKCTFTAFSPLMDKQILYMRKLVSEGLFDPEAFKQNDTQAKEKMAVGKVAVVGCHYVWLKDNLGNTLYKDHPEMEYVPLGPILDANNKTLMPGQTQLKGMAGCPIVVITKSCKEPEAAVKLLEFLSSEEGMKLTLYGIEGTHYTMVDGKPRMTQEWLDKYKKDPQLLRNEGIQSTYALYALDSRMSKFGEANPGDSVKKDDAFEKAKSMSPLNFVDGYRITYIMNQYPQLESIKDQISLDLLEEVREKAYFAKTDDAALKILNDYRQQLKKSGIEDLQKYLTDKASERNDIIY